MESKVHISESVKEEVRKAMDDAKETMGKEEDLPPHAVGYKVFREVFLEQFEVFATKIYLKIEELNARGLVEKTNPENDGSKNTQLQKTNGVNVIHPTRATSTIEKPEEGGISRCGPEITKEMATTEQQRLIAEEGAKMNEKMLTPNAVQPDSGLCLKNQTLDGEMFTLHEKQPDSDRSLKKPRYEVVIRDDDPQAEQPDAILKQSTFNFDLHPRI